jgi:O-antigen/teichoic acid export membrane protein
MAVGLGAIAPTLAGLSLNSRWVGAGPMLMWLSVISFPRPLSGAVSSYMQVRNQKRAFLMLELFTLGILFASLFTIGRISPIAACIAVGATFLARLVATAGLLWLTDGVRPWTFFAPQVPPLAASLVMAGLVTAARAGLERAGVPLFPSLVAQIAVGVAGYAAAAWLFARRAFQEIVALTKSAISRRRRRP